MVVAVSKQKDASYLLNNIHYDLTTSDAQIYSQMKGSTDYNTHPYAALWYPSKTYTFNNNINKSNKTLTDERTKQKQRGHEYGTHHFLFDINIHHTAIRMS